MALLAAAMLPGLQIMSAASEAVVTRNGWSFDRCQFHNSNAELEAALKKKGFGLPLTGWTEFKLSVPKQGWYELWIGGIPMDGLVTYSSMGKRYSAWDCLTPRTMKGLMSQERWSSKRRICFSAKEDTRCVSGDWDFLGPCWASGNCDWADNPAGCIRARVNGSPIIEPGGKVSLRVTGGATSPTHYKLVLKNEMTGAITPGCDVDFPASATAADQDVEIPVAEEGVYQILAQVDGKLLRPSDLKAGDILVAKGPAPAPPADPNILAVAGPFSPGAVLQRDKPLPVWGSTAPGEEVTVTLAGQAKKAKCARRWPVAGGS